MTDKKPDFIDNVITAMESRSPDVDRIRRGEESCLTFWASSVGSFSLHWTHGEYEPELRVCDQHIELSEDEETRLWRWIEDKYYNMSRLIAEENFARTADTIRGKEKN